MSNYKKGNKDYNYEIETSYTEFAKVLKKLETKEDRKAAFQIMYVVYNDYDLLKKWSLEDLENYVYETLDDCYLKDYKKILKIIKSGKDNKLDNKTKDREEKSIKI